MAETNGSSGKPVTSEELKAAVSELKTELLQGMERIETALLTAFHGYAQGVFVTIQETGSFGAIAG